MSSTRPRHSEILLTRLTRRFFPRSAGFPVRQGVANLFRPQNQTLAVTMAVGFGVFMLSGLWVVQRNLLDWIRVDTIANALK
jgi:putative ABC transport system permease protein